jgi:hypothetical protein
MLRPVLQARQSTTSALQQTYFPNWGQSVIPGFFAQYSWTETPFEQAKQLAMYAIQHMIGSLLTMGEGMVELQLLGFKLQKNSRLICCLQALHEF